jgi:hypothetical protein
MNFLYVLGISLASGVYDEIIGLKAAKLAHIAYCSIHEIETWSPTCDYTTDVEIDEVKVFQSGKILRLGEEIPPVQAFLAKEKWHFPQESAGDFFKNDCYLAFKGTDNWKAMFLIDPDFIQEPMEVSDNQPATICQSGNCLVHGGFYAAYFNLHADLTQAIEDLDCGSLLVTGHSMGAALGTVALPYLKASLDVDFYQFGSPRVGNDQFAREFDAKFGKHSYRVTHAMDPVPHLPILNYQHVSQEIFYKGDLPDGYVECETNVEDIQCSAQFATWVTILHVDDHLNYLGIRLR